MANRNFRPLGGSLTQGVICLTGEFTYGVDGAVTDVDCDGFTVGALSNGLQDITLDDKYTEFVGFHATFAIKGAMDLRDEAEETPFVVDLPMLAVAYSETVSTDRAINMACVRVADGALQTTSSTLANDFPRGTKASVLIWVKNSSV